MKEDTLFLKGKIVFDPVELTKKHQKQSSWKKVAMIVFSGDICNYYSWFILKRFNLTLNPPHDKRGPHISFINDSINDMTNGTNKEGAEIKWNQLKKDWNNVEVEVEIKLIPQTDGKHWWFNLSEESTVELQKLRSLLGLGKPFYDFHLTIGYANERNEYHSEYIYNLRKLNLTNND